MGTTSKVIVLFQQTLAALYAVTAPFKMFHSYLERSFGFKARRMLYYICSDLCSYLSFNIKSLMGERKYKLRLHSLLLSVLCTYQFLRNGCAVFTALKWLCPTGQPELAIISILTGVSAFILASLLKWPSTLNIFSLILGYALINYSTKTYL